MEAATREEQVYRNDQAGVKVFRGWFKGSQVAVKCLKHHSLASANIALREAMTTMRVQHCYICRVLDCKLQEGDDGLETELLTEWMDGGDLAKDIERRQPTECYWSNEELRRHMYYLVEALALAQNNGVAHRDIKPQNILWNSQGQVKITDFGSSLYNVEARLTLTLQGSPFYLSPELKRSYVERRGQIGQVQYDPYRSDVYSLGLTLLQVARLKPPNDLMDLETLERDTVRVLGELGYDEDIRDFLGLMLGVANRPNFSELFYEMQMKYCPQIPSEVQPVVQYEQPAVQYEQPAVQYEQPAVQYEQPAVQYEQPAVQYVQPFQETHHVDIGARESFAPAAAYSVSIPPISDFTPYCGMCSKRNSPTKRWRKYMPRQYDTERSLFGRVCTPDCLDELIKNREQVTLSKCEIDPNTCGLCGTSITSFHKVCKLQCPHQICGWQCLVSTLRMQPKTLRCRCNCEISNRTRKDILQLCKSPTIKYCLICQEKTDRSAKCKHPICKECADAHNTPLTKHCLLCSKSPQ